MTDLQHAVKEASDRSPEHGLQVTMLTGFGLVIMLTLLIAGWSYYHITMLGHSAEHLFVENYRSIEYARVMDSSASAIQSHAIAHDLSKETLQTLGDKIDHSISLEFANITEPGEAEAAKKLQHTYARFFDTISAHQNEWTESEHAAMDSLLIRIELVRSINEHAMFHRADAAQSSAEFARYSTLAITLALVFVAILLALGVSRRSLAELRELDRAKSNFVATAAHELRNPLSSIKTSTSMLVDGMAGPVTTKQVDMLTNIKSESERLLALVRELLDLARLEAGTLQLRLDAIDPHSLVESAVLPMMLQAEHAQIHVDLHVPTTLPKVSVDPNKISWAITNLFANAIRYSPKGGTITITGSEIDNEVWIAVRDEGKGIAPPDLERIFGKFVQVEDATMGGGSGSGLGLSIAREIVHAHKGRIWADSTVGQGTTFTIALPLKYKR
jgi:signal transduction histidine kinase